MSENYEEPEGEISPLEEAVKKIVFTKRSSILRSKKFSGNFIVQYNIWLNGKRKLKKNIEKQNIKAKKDFPP